MTSVNWNNAVPEQYAPAASSKTAGAGTASAAGSKVQTPDVPADTLELSAAALQELALTGRVALNEQAGNLTSDQAAQLNGQTSSIQSQIVADKQANGGTLSSSDAQAIQ